MQAGGLSNRSNLVPRSFSGVADNQPKYDAKYFVDQFIDKEQEEDKDKESEGDSSMSESSEEPDLPPAKSGNCEMIDENSEEGLDDDISEQMDLQN